MRELLVLYGSETGTSQDLAEQLWRESLRWNVPIRVRAFDDYQLNNLPSEEFVIFLISTSGQGDVPFNMRANWRKLLNSRIPTHWLFGLRFAIFGLGDSSYQKYNFAAKKLMRRILQLGAELALPAAYGDDQHQLGPFGEFENFLSAIFGFLTENKMFPAMIETPSDDFPLKYSLEYNCSTSEPSDLSQLNLEGGFLPLKCVENRRVTASEHFQNTFLISLDPGKHAKEFEYSAGDVLMIHPENHSASVDLAVAALGYSAEILDRPFRIRATDPNISTPPKWLIGDPTSLRTCFRILFDLQMIPRRSFFHFLSLHSNSDAERERLSELSDIRNLDEYLDYAQRPRRTVAETLRDFVATSAQLRPEILFDLFCTIRPRAFSIASSPLVDSTIQLMIAEVEYAALRMKERRRGLCSSFLSNLRPNDEVLARRRPGTIRLNPKTEFFVLIGCGTGVAPIRSLAHQLSHKDLTIIVGCRSPLLDNYFFDEWPKTATVLYAYSRPPNPADKKYVQDSLSDIRTKLWTQIQTGLVQIFICGRSKDMPDAIVGLLRELAEENGMEDPVEFVNSMERSGVLQFETWD